MNKWLYLTETDAYVARACVAPLLAEHVDDQMHKKSSGNEFENYENDADVMEKIARSEIIGLPAEEVDWNYAEGTQAKE